MRWKPRTTSHRRFLQRQRQPQSSRRSTQPAPYRCPNFVADPCSTVEPTNEPDPDPTLMPTKYPTGEPTNYPVPNPTSNPTSYPSPFPPSSMVNVSITMSPFNSNYEEEDYNCGTICEANQQEFTGDGTSNENVRQFYTHFTENFSYYNITCNNTHISTLQPTTIPYVIRPKVEPNGSTTHFTEVETAYTSEIKIKSAYLDNSISWISTLIFTGRLYAFATARRHNPAPTLVSTLST